jgi:alpha-mannosidase
VVSENGRPIDGVGAVVVDVVKDADDRSGDVIVRCHESGGRRVDAVIGLPDGWGPATAVDIYESPEVDAGESSPTVVSTGDGCRVSLRPFQVRTLRIGRPTPTR